MAKKRKATTPDQTQEVIDVPVTDTDGPQAATAARAEAPEGEATAAASAGPQPFAAVQAPPAVEGRRPWVTDNRLGYRVEDAVTPSGEKVRQVRFADREGGERPDDELLEPVRKRKGVIRYSSKPDKSWQARQRAEGYEAIDDADRELAEIGRQRGGSPRR